MGVGGGGEETNFELANTAPPPLVQLPERPYLTNQSQEPASVTAITISHLLVGLFPSTLHWLKWLFILCSLVLYDFCFSSLIECEHHESKGLVYPVHPKISSAKNSAWSQDVLSK